MSSTFRYKLLSSVINHIQVFNAYIDKYFDRPSLKTRGNDSRPSTERSIRNITTVRIKGLFNECFFYCIVAGGGIEGLGGMGAEFTGALGQSEPGGPGFMAAQGPPPPDQMVPHRGASPEFISSQGTT